MPIAALEGVSLFDGLEPGDLVAVASSMRFRDFAAREPIFQEGEPGGSMFVIVEGLVQVLVSTPLAEAERSRSVFAEGRVVARLRPGEVFGTESLVTGEPRSGTAIAQLPTGALELRDEDFTELVGRYPGILANLARILSGRLAEANVRRARGGRRGEAVCLLVSEALAQAVDPVVESTRAASPHSVASVDTRAGAEHALGQLDSALQEHGTVVVVAGLDPEALPRILEQVDRTVALLSAAEEAGGVAAAAAAAAVPARVELVVAGGTWSLRPQDVDGMPVVRVTRPGDAGVDLPPEDLAWLGRHLSRTKLGLALGAGGAKGYAHVGALAVLERAGYTVDCVAGSSIGAIVGTYLALGMDAASIDTALRDVFDPDTLEQIFKRAMSGGSTGAETTARKFREATAGRTFDDLRIPLAVMAVDLTDREPEPIREGLLWEALMAGTALAGMFPPYERDGHRMVDGVALVPVPTGSVVEDGADVTVSVNLMSREVLSAWPGTEAPPEAPPRQRGSRMLDTILEVMDLSQLDTSVRHAELADVVVTPRFGPGSWRDFHLADRFLEAGREAMEQHVDDLRALARPQLAPGLP